MRSVPARLRGGDPNGQADFDAFLCSQCSASVLDPAIPQAFDGDDAERTLFGAKIERRRFGDAGVAQGAAQEIDRVMEHRQSLHVWL